MLLQITEPDRPTQRPSLDTVVGIDLGTTHSVIGIYDEQQNLKLLSDDEGEVLIPSVMAWHHGQIYVGQKAQAFVEPYPDHVIHSIKRLVGKGIDDPIIQAFSHPILLDNPHCPQVRLDDRLFYPVEITAHILRYLKEIAERSLSMPVHKAVITIPAHFDEAARLATREAAEIAGLEVVRLLHEPTAAAVAYGLDEKEKGTILVYDLGGGTFDVSILKLTQGVFQVIATGGDLFLGGDDIDRALAQSFLQDTSKLALRQMKGIKEALSHQASVHSPKIGTVTQEHLKTIATPYIDRTIVICQQTLRDAGLTPADIDRVILVGGSSRLQLVHKHLQALFGDKLLSSLNPDEVVAMGAARQAYNLSKGAGPLLLDVCPLSLGLETMGGLVEKMIPHNAPIPTLVEQDFTTYQDGQTAMSIHIVQGEREFVKDCRSLARFELYGIPPMRAGGPRIHVRFMLDADGLLTVTAQEKTTGIFQEVIVKPSYGLDASDIQRMILESQQFGKQDIEQRLLMQKELKKNKLSSTEGKL